MKTLGEEMKRILSYGNRKSDPMFWDISNEELFKKAVLELFNHLDKSWQVYMELTNEEDDKLCEECDGNRNIKLKTGVFTCPKCDGYSPSKEDIKRVEAQKKLYNLAKSGDAKSAYQLLNARKTYEYEEWHVYDVRS